jgi:hypothetical protein
MSYKEPERPEDKRSDVRKLPDPDRLRIYAESGGFCCYPDCDQFLVADEGETLNSGQIAHIRGRQKDAARHQAAYPDEQLDSFENTILMCYKHHHRIDSHQTRRDYPIEAVESMKANASAKFACFRRSGPAAPTFALIDELCTDLANRTGEPDFSLDRIKITEKIRVNELTPALSASIFFGLSQRHTIEEYLSIKADTETRFPERVQSSIKARYFDLVAAEYPKERIYKLMVGMVQGASASLEKANASQVIVAYFFQMCDIFEKE